MLFLVRDLKILPQALLLVLAQVFFLNPVNALSLEELMNDSSSSGQSSNGSKSLLDGIDEARANNEKTDSLTLHQKLFNTFNQSCACVASRNCDSYWFDRTGWNKSNSFLSYEKTAYVEANKECGIPLKKISANSRTQDIDSQNNLLSAANNILSNIKSNMHRYGRDDRWEVARLEKHQKQQADEDRKRREWEAKKAARAAEDEASSKQAARENAEFIARMQANEIDVFAMPDFNKMHKDMLATQNANKKQQASTSAGSATNTTRTNSNIVSQAESSASKQSKIASARITASEERLRQQKEKCLQGGHSWNEAGNVCDRTFNVMLGGVAYTCDSPYVTEAPGMECDDKKGSSNPGSKNPGKGSDAGSQNGNNNIASSGNTNSNSNNGSGSGNSGQQNSNDQFLISSVIKRAWGTHSWPTKEKACYYAINQIKEKATKICKTEYRGVPARESETRVPFEGNCQSYRQIEKSTIWHSAGEWMAEAAATLKCKITN